MYILLNTKSSFDRQVRICEDRIKIMQSVKIKTNKGLKKVFGRKVFELQLIICKCLVGEY